MIRFVILLLGGTLLVTPAHATTFRVDAESEGSTIVDRGCLSRVGDRCCNACHLGQAKTAKQPNPPKHDLALYGKHVVQVAEGQKLKVRGDSFVMKEKGRLVLYEGKKRTVLPASTVIVRDGGGRAAVVLGE